MRHRLVLVTLLLLAGCGGGERVLLGPAPEGPPAGTLALGAVSLGYEPSSQRPRVEAGAVPLPSHYRLNCVACEEVQVAAGQELVAPCAECGGESFQTPFVRPLLPTLDVGRIAAELSARLRERGGFGAVFELAPEAAQGDALAAARAQDADYLLDVVLADASCSFSRTNWVQPLKIVGGIVQWLLIFPGLDPLNWFLAGELYQLETLARWRLRDTRTGQVVAEGEVSPRIEEPFAAFGLGVGGRPWFLAGWLRAPDCLDEEDWEVVSGQLQPAAEIDVARATVLAVEAATRAE
jgi:hypothetical protein